jgi:Manganese containing catalase
MRHASARNNSVFLKNENRSVRRERWFGYMIHRFDKLATELPEPAAPNAKAAAAVQELMGGKFGEMSTIMNYTFQSFNFRARTKFRPFYDLVTNIAAEEYSHIAEFATPFTSRYVERRAFFNSW